MRYFKQRLNTLNRQIEPDRQIEKIRYVSSEEEAEELSQELPPWQPGDGIRFILAFPPGERRLV